MTTTYLRFPDEPTAKAALACYVVQNSLDPSKQLGNWITASHEHALDPVGTITTPGTYDADGNPLTAPVALSGWHVNLIGAVPDAAAAYVVAPAAPARVFA